MQDAIEKEMKKITIKQEEIIKYQDECQWMQAQMDAIHYSISALLKDNIPEMKSVKERVIENEQKVRINKKKNSMQKYRFEKYRKAISIETRLFELEKKIKAAWRRDEIWAGIRDWGFLSGKAACVCVCVFYASYVCRRLMYLQLYCSLFSSHSSSHGNPNTVTYISCQENRVITSLVKYTPTPTFTYKYINIYILYRYKTFYSFILNQNSLHPERLDCFAKSNTNPIRSRFAPCQ